MFCCLSAGGDSSHSEHLLGPQSQHYNHSQSRTACALNLPDLPEAALARILASLSFSNRCQCTLVCSSWNSIIKSAPAHDPVASEAVASEDWSVTRTASSDICATADQQQYKLHLCPVIRHASSAAVWLCSAGLLTLQQLSSVTRLQLLDPRIDLEHSQFTACKAPASLAHLRQLQVLNLAMSSPALVDLHQLPSSLQCLHLNLSSGYSIAQLKASCAALAAAGPGLPRLGHLSLGLELDALLSYSGGEVLSGLSALTQLTSLALTDYQLMHPDSPAHEGYYAVPPVIQQLPQLSKVELRLCSGHRAELQPLAAVPEVSLMLTLARHEQAQFCRLPSTLAGVTGLTSLYVLMAEYDYESTSQLYVFDVSTLALCQQLRSLLLELHGSKSSQHDLRGLGQLHSLDELVVLFKCPDVHEARSAGTVSSGSAASAGTAAYDEAVVDQAGARGLSNWLSSYYAGSSSSKLKKQKSVIARLARAVLGCQEDEHAGSAGAAARAEHQGSSITLPERTDSLLVEEEWVLRLLDAALDQLRPEFALSVPQVSGRLLLATTSRLLLRQPENVRRSGQPMLLASHLQLDCEASSSDSWSGESFLQQRGPRALCSWVVRNWLPWGVQLHAAARYPQLGSYPSCGRRIDDRLLVAAKLGVRGEAVVQTLMDVVEERCLTYFY